MRLAKISCLLLLSLLVACGSDSTRNSGGTSILFFGWFQDGGGGTGATGAFAPYSALTANVNLFAGVQNNLAGQLVTIDRAKHSYYIPGATIDVPDTVIGTSGLLRPAALPEDTFGNTVSTLPENAFSGDSASYLQTPIIPLQIAEFLNLNRNSLPDTPYDMIVTTTLEGVTSAGARIETNQIQFNITVLADIAIEAPGAAANAATTTEEGTIAGLDNDSDESDDNETVTNVPNGTGDNSDVTFF